MGVFNFIAFLGALVLAVGGGGAVWVYDHHPPMGVHQKVLFLRVGFDLPESLRMQRDQALAAAVQARLAGSSCRADLVNAQSAVAAQNAAVEALRRDGEAMVAQSRRAVEGARAVAASERARADAILTLQPSSTDDCKAAAALIDEEAAR